MGIYIAIAAISYLIGSINFSVIFSKKLAGFDLREKGSKNAGTTNMLRTVGKKGAALVLICDILKGVVPVIIAKLISGNVNSAIACQISGFFAVLGHCFPIFFEFKGGKGVATSIGILLVLNWQIGLICLMYGIIMVILTRMVSLGSITAAILFPVLTIFIRMHYISEGFNYTVFGIIMAVFILYNHRGNIKRLNEGTENRISFRK
ncbi:MAG: glycerol-3-phosphate 1-O-acyltransferase PlsY [Clostridia bacterium]|nr:glycerol-3-phosphate 1-O-acyltransferase PlsY [Clostridia bacterium]